MKKLLCLCGCLLAGWSLAGTEEEDATVVKTGQAAPEFSVTTLDGKSIDLKDCKGKVVLVNFFATWCGPCMEEMPHVRDQIWNQFKDKNFVLLAIDREEDAQVVTAFQKKTGYGFPIACDPKREVYSKFATKFIPRSFLIDANGTIVFETVGNSPADFTRLTTMIQQETAKGH